MIKLNDTETNVLHFIKKGTITTKSLSLRTGKTPSLVSRAIRNLIEYGLVEPRGVNKSTTYRAVHDSRKGA